MKSSFYSATIKNARGCLGFIAHTAARISVTAGLKMAGSAVSIMAGFTIFAEGCSNSRENLEVERIGVGFAIAPILAKSWVESSLLTWDREKRRCFRVTIF